MSIPKGGETPYIPMYEIKESHRAAKPKGEGQKSIGQKIISQKKEEMPKRIKDADTKWEKAQLSQGTKLPEKIIAKKGEGIILSKKPKITQKMVDADKAFATQQSKHAIPREITEHETYIHAKPTAKRALGLKVPEHHLGSTKLKGKEVDGLVKNHRNPQKKTGESFTSKDCEALSLTKIRDSHVEERKQQAFMAQNNIPDKSKIDPDKYKTFQVSPRIVSVWKEEGNVIAYKLIQDRIDQNLYHPEAIAAEIKKDLGVNDAVPAGINSKDVAMKAIKEELNQFQKGFEGKKILTNELRHHLEKDIEETMDLYMQVYPNKTAEDAFIVCRDLGRNAVYQLLHDKHSFTGSDHGVLHIHHNCKNGENMHKHMEKGDMSPKAQLLSRVMHFYHDIGYSVGSGTDFSVMKDHPFVGAAFIEANKKYFDHYFDEDSTAILKESILHHAIVSFNSKVKDDHAMVRFTTSNSDACAVTADQKTQSFWRENPETLLSLAKLRQFLTIYPEMADRSKLSHSSIMKNPEIPLPLKPNVDPKRFFDKKNPLTENDFKNPLDFKAWSIYSSVREELLAVAEKQHLPPEEKEAFKRAIEDNFNAFSGDIVLGQYGAELNSVSVAKNTKVSPEEPKYLPAIDLSPSILFSFLESCYSKETAGKNITKVCNEEYSANPNEISDALDQVGKGANKINVKSDVAQITISNKKPVVEREGLNDMELHAKKINMKKLKKVESELVQIQKQVIPFETRRALNDVVGFINKISEAADTKTFLELQMKLDVAKSKLDTKIDMTPFQTKVQAALNASIDLLSTLDQDPTKWTPKQRSEIKESIIDIRGSCVNDYEKQMLGL